MTVRYEHLDLPFTPEAVRRARSLVRDCAAGMSSSAVDNAELLVSEVVTNAVLHGAPVIAVTVVVGVGEVIVRIADGNSDVPTTRVPGGADATSGRGLKMLEVLSVAWGVEVSPGQRGKTVWFRVTDFPTPGKPVLESER